MPPSAKTFISKAPRSTATSNGRSPSTVITRSVEFKSAKHPPIARSEVEAKKAVPFCRPAMIDVSIILRSRSAACRTQAARCRLMT